MLGDLIPTLKQTSNQYIGRVAVAQNYPRTILLRDYANIVPLLFVGQRLSLPDFGSRLGRNIHAGSSFRRVQFVRSAATGRAIPAFTSSAPASATACSVAHIKDWP